MRASRRGSAVGLGSCVAWIFLQESVLTLSNVALFNFCLYACMGQVASYLALACAGALRNYQPTAALARAAGIAGAASLPLQFAPAAPAAIAGALLMGASSGVLLTMWGVRLSKVGARRAFILVLGSFLVGVLVTGVCFFAQGASFSLACILGIVLPLMAAFASPKSEPAPPQVQQRVSLPWPFLLTLVASCLFGSFFQGVATSPWRRRAKRTTCNGIPGASFCTDVTLYWPATPS